jgi:microcystin-dependent protein
MRAQRRNINQNVLLNNRLSNLTNPHNYVGDLHIERNATIGGNLDVSGDLHASSFYATGNYYLDTYVLIPAGTIVQSAAIYEPAGWFDCDGRTLSVFVNADLFDAIGYEYSRNVFSGSDLSFNIPDMRGRVGIGYGTGPAIGLNAALTTRSLGDISGAETHRLTTPEMPAHDHGGSTGSTTSAMATPATTSESTAHAVADNGPHSHTIAIDGSGNAHNNMQPFLVIRYLIKY